jgi:hypothetical protein
LKSIHFQRARIKNHLALSKTLTLIQQAIL